MKTHDKLKLWIEKKYKNQAIAAKRLGYNHSTSLNQYITGKRKLGRVILDKLKSEGCDINWLLDETDTTSEKGQVTTNNSEITNNAPNYGVNIGQQQGQDEMVNIVVNNPDMKSSVCKEYIEEIIRLKAQNELLKELLQQKKD